VQYCVLVRRSHNSAVMSSYCDVRHVAASEKWSSRLSSRSPSDWVEYASRSRRPRCERGRRWLATDREDSLIVAVHQPAKFSRDERRSDADGLETAEEHRSRRRHWSPAAILDLHSTQRVINHSIQ